ncbi:MAG TPA: DNA repair protein RecN, partial [Planctomycetota bacterium]|nr:DNA repair protein RecN [Planctomycetota bacterium]
EATILVDEAAHELAAGLDRLDLDPREEAATRERLAALDRLYQRFGPGEDEVFEAQAAMTAELERLLDESRSPEALADRLAELEVQASEVGAELTKARRVAAKKLSTLMVRELADLSMSRVRVDVRVTEHEAPTFLERASNLGTSEVAVFMAPNPGEPMTALHETASGGEVARVMLVLKKILADADCVPILVFDEADAEIGGRLGLQVGRKLRAVAQSHQVLCVTHLPQIAAFADQHCLVSKRVDKGRTISELSVLVGEARERELASMARGEALDAQALEEASRLIALAREEA